MASLHPGERRFFLVADEQPGLLDGGVAGAGLGGGLHVQEDILIAQLEARRPRAELGRHVDVARRRPVVVEPLVGGDE